MDNNIKDVIRDYLDACYESNVEKFRQVMHKTTYLYKHDGDSSMKEIPLEDFIKIVEASHQNSPTPNFPQQDEVIAIDFLGDNTAVARVKVRVGNIMFSDILSLMLLDGKWMIVSKVFSGAPIE